MSGLTEKANAALKAKRKADDQKKREQIEAATKERERTKANRMERGRKWMREKFGVEVADTFWYIDPSSVQSESDPVPKGYPIMRTRDNVYVAYFRAQIPANDSVTIVDQCPFEGCGQWIQRGNHATSLIGIGFLLEIDPYGDKDTHLNRHHRTYHARDLPPRKETT